MGIFLQGAAYNLLHSISNSWKFNISHAGHDITVGLDLLSCLSPLPMSPAHTPPLILNTLHWLHLAHSLGGLQIPEWSSHFLSCWIHLLPLVFKFTRWQPEGLSASQMHSSCLVLITVLCKVHDWSHHSPFPPPLCKGFTLAITSMIILFTLVSPPPQAKTPQPVLMSSKLLSQPRNSFIFSLWIVIH